MSKAFLYGVGAKPALLGSKSITENGTYLASDDNLDGYSSVEVNIQGAIETGQFKATFIDYDGEIITIKRKDFGSILTLPEPPQNDRFSFVEWRCSETITDNSIVMPACDIVVGALRTPANGYSQIDIELTPATGLLFKGFSVRSDEPYTTKTRIYYGDGSSEWGEYTNSARISHTYASYGKYTITIQQTTCTYYVDRDPPTATTAIKAAIIGVYLSPYYAHSGFTYGEFDGAVSLKSIIIPAITARAQMFNNTPNLKCIILPEGGVFATRTFGSMKSLKYLIAPYISNFTSVFYAPSFSALEHFDESKDTATATPLTGTTQITKRFFPSNILSFMGTVMTSPTGPFEFDFSQHQQVPTLSNITAFANLNQQTKFYIPTALFATWSTATNWTTYAAYMVAV